jgi:TATA-binding protein-associated factor Taf7
MSVSDHLKQASAELVKAAELVKVEIDDLRKQETQSRHDIENYISQLIVQIQHHEREQRRVDNPQLSAQHQATLARLQKELADKRTELVEMQRNIQNAIQQKSSMVSGLESQASSIRP